MDKQYSRISPLARVEMEAWDAGREWTRRKIERDLQKLADQEGAFSPCKRRKADSPALPYDPAENPCW